MFGISSSGPASSSNSAVNVQPLLVETKNADTSNATNQQTSNATNQQTSNATNQQTPNNKRKLFQEPGNSKSKVGKFASKNFIVEEDPLSDVVASLQLSIPIVHPSQYYPKAFLFKSKQKFWVGMYNQNDTLQTISFAIEINENSYEFLRINDFLKVSNTQVMSASQYSAAKKVWFGFMTNGEQLVLSFNVADVEGTDTIISAKPLHAKINELYFGGVDLMNIPIKTSESINPSQILGTRPDPRGFINRPPYPPNIKITHANCKKALQIALSPH